MISEPSPARNMAQLKLVYAPSQYEGSLDIMYFRVLYCITISNSCTNVNHALRTYLRENDLEDCCDDNMRERLTTLEYVQGIDVDFKLTSLSFVFDFRFRIVFKLFEGS